MLLRQQKLLFTVFVICAYLFISFLSSRFLKSNDDFNFSEPANGGYRSDESIFLKTFYLMKQGNSYYSSFKYASENGSRKINLTHDASLWRFPTIFYVWSLTSHEGFQIFNLFWTLVLISLILIYLILRKFVGSLIAIAGPTLLVPYFADVFAYRTSFLFTEWWALFFYLAGLCLLIYQKKPFVFFFILAVVTRELLIIPILLLFFYSLLIKKNRLLFLLVIFVFIAFTQFHRMIVLRQEVLPVAAPLISRLHSFDKDSFLSMISFSMRKYPFVAYKFHYLILFTSLLSFLVNLFVKIKSNAMYVFLSGLSGFLVFPFITTSVYNDYWGILFMPILIATIPLILFPFKFSK